MENGQLTGKRESKNFFLDDLLSVKIPIGIIACSIVYFATMITICYNGSH